VAFYDKRADMEEAIHELTDEFGVDRISSISLGANVVHLALTVLAFILLVPYQRQILGWQRQILGWSVRQRAKTLRRRVLAIVGQVIPPPHQRVVAAA
jgi:hypothetical protein